MSKDIITSLTPAQEAKLQEYYDMGLNLGLNTQSIDQDKAKECINEDRKSVV
jgi:hypothetical protein